MENPYLWKNPVRVFGWLAETTLVGVCEYGVGHRTFAILYWCKYASLVDLDCLQ